MLGYRWIVISCIFLISAFLSKAEEEKIDIELTYKKGVQYYNYNSYYDAMREFQKILKYTNSPYYNKTLFMMSKVYLKIGKRTGVKKYLWSSLYYLNIYASRTKKYNWDYYMLKGNIYEALGFYERAMSIYKIASSYIENDKQITDTMIALLRVSVEFGKMDYITMYLVQAGTQVLEKEQEKELIFVLGMIDFAKKRYKEAMEKFIKTYREFETYLVDNPEYYYIVAENAYRLGNYKFARKLFRRISSIVKDASIIRKSILRIGDIGLKLGDLTTAITNYYTVASKYPETKEGIVAKLKLISLAQKDIKVKARILAFDKEFFKDSIKFVAETLVKNRTGYIGKFAIGNFGQIVMNSDSESLFKRLEWELSLLYPPKLEYEHREYIRFLWKDLIKKQKPDRICSLYTSNPDFFKMIFDTETFLVISQDLKVCKKFEERIELLKYMLTKRKEDEIRIRLAEALYDAGKFTASLQMLESVKEKDCEYAKLFGKNLYSLKVNLESAANKIKKLCSREDIEATSILALYWLDTDLVEKAVDFAVKNIKPIGEKYGKKEVVNWFVRKLFIKLDVLEYYSELFKISSELFRITNDLCNIGSILIISGVRTGKIEEIKDLSEKMDSCKGGWAEIARQLYESYMITKEVKNE